MTVQTPPWAIQASSHPATAVRQASQGQMGSPVGSFAGGVQPTTGGGGHGVCGSGDLAVAQHSTPNMSVDVAAGLVAVRGTENAGQGVYGPCYNDALVTLTIAAADPTNARKDLIVARIRDAQYSGASNDFALVVVTGTPAGSPVDPSVPADSVVLARVNVAANAASIVNANITDLRPRASALGGATVTTSALRPTGAALYPGLTIYETDTGNELVYDGTNWLPPKNSHGGTLAYTPQTANSTGITAEATLATLSTTKTTLAGRRYKFTVFFRDWYSTVAGDTITIRIKEDGTTIAEASGQANGGSTATTLDWPVAVRVPSAGSHAYTVTAFRASGTGSITIEAGATYPGFLLIEDIGV